MADLSAIRVLLLLACLQITSSLLPGVGPPQAEFSALQCVRRLTCVCLSGYTAAVMRKAGEDGKSLPLFKRIAGRLASVPSQLRQESMMWTKATPSEIQESSEDSSPPEERETFGARVRRRLASIRGSRRIASMRLLLRNITEWEFAVLGGPRHLMGVEWLSPNSLPEKLMGSYRLARAVEVMGGWRAPQAALRASSTALPGRIYEAGALQKPIGEKTLDSEGLQRLQAALAKLVLAGTEDELGYAGDSNWRAQDKRFHLLIHQWSEGIAAAYATPHTLIGEDAEAPSPSGATTALLRYLLLCLLLLLTALLSTYYY
jgi:hypothetical protein